MFFYVSGIRRNFTGACYFLGDDDDGGGWQCYRRVLGHIPYHWPALGSCLPAWLLPYRHKKSIIEAYTHIRAAWHWMYDKLHNLAGYHKLLQAVCGSGSESGLALFLLSVPNMLPGNIRPHVYMYYTCTRCSSSSWTQLGFLNSSFIAYYSNFYFLHAHNNSSASEVACNNK